LSAAIASVLELLSLPPAASSCHTLRDAAEHFALLAQQKIFPRPTFFTSWLGPCVLAYGMPPGSFRKFSESEQVDRQRRGNAPRRHQTGARVNRVGLQVQRHRRDDCDAAT